jgi:phosphoenolpyruvate carboxykinase (ATP)
MLNEYVYRLGGLVMHAGAKKVKVGGKTLTMGILGLSGTGKTTTTFSKQGELAQPIQDDMIVLWPDGTCTITENGCFAKTYGLTPESEPVIYQGTIHSDAWVENVFPNPDGTYDFSKGRLTPQEVARLKNMLIDSGAPPENVEAFISGKVKIDEVVNEDDIPQDGWDFTVWTQNGRSIIPMKAIKDAASFDNIPQVKSLGILNRDEGPDAAMPGIVRFPTPELAAGYFMLGETSKTSAAGKERGKTRSPFTQPFFTSPFGLQAKRFSELASKLEGLETWLMNTGYVGGDAKAEAQGKALKVKIPHSSAMLEAMLSGKIKWTLDPDFGYQIVDVNAKENAELLKKVPKEILNPEIFFENNGRSADYRAWVERMKKEREEFLNKFNVDRNIVEAVSHR